MSRPLGSLGRSVDPSLVAKRNQSARRSSDYTRDNKGISQTLLFHQQDFFFNQIFEIRPLFQIRLALLNIALFLLGSQERRRAANRPSSPSSVLWDKGHSGHYKGEEEENRRLLHGQKDRSYEK